MDTVPLDVVKQHILPYLEFKDKCSYWSTCKKLYLMYNLKQKLTLFIDAKLENNTKVQCIACKLHVYLHRYKQHVNKCVINSWSWKERTDLLVNVHTEQEKINYLSDKPHLTTNMIVNKTQTCVKCKSYGRMPQLFAGTLKHPFVKCKWCRIGISRTSVGCLDCGFTCVDEDCTITTWTHIQTISVIVVVAAYFILF